MATAERNDLGENKDGDKGKVTEKNKGGLKSWATDEQKEWLNSRIPSYIKSRSGEAPANFWGSTFDEWFTKWPSAGDGDDLKKRKTQIKDYFKNHTRASGSIGDNRRNVISLLPKKSKKLPLWQAYSKRFYEEKVKDVVQERWSAKYRTENPEQGDKELPPPPMQFRNEVTRNMFDGETDETKDEIRVYRDKLGTEDSETIDDDGVEPEERERRKVAAAYQACIDAMQPTMAAALGEAQKMTGYIGMVLLAGPEPKQGGTIQVMEFHTGKSPAGYVFSQAHADYERNVLIPFRNFACRVFPPAVRAARSLPGTEHLGDYVVGDPHPTHQPGLAASGSGLSTPSVPVLSDEESSTLHSSRTASRAPTAQPSIAVSDSDDPSDDPKSGRNSPERGVTWSPSPKPSDDKPSDDKLNDNEPNDNLSKDGEPSDKETGRRIVKKRKTLEEELRRLKTKAAMKKKLARLSGLGKEPVKSIASRSTGNPSNHATTPLSATPTPSRVPASSVHASPTSVMSQAGEHPFSVDDEAKDWPSWLQNHLPELQASFSSIEMRSLVRNLSVLDVLLGHPTSKRTTLLPSTGRPNAIGVWITGGRKTSPKIDNLQDFIQTWKAWWKSLQPHSRAASRAVKLPRKISPDENWESLQKGGLNGFFTIVASLSWWLAEVKTDVQRKDFDSTASDVLWAQEQVIQSLRGSSLTQEGSRRTRSTKI